MYIDEFGLCIMHWFPCEQTRLRQKAMRYKDYALWHYALWESVLVLGPEAVKSIRAMME